MGFGEDVYYNPEKFNLEPVAEFDFSDGNYQFDLRMVWRSTEGDGMLYTARDSGCSCPSPFEDYTTLASLEQFDLDSLLSEADYEKDHGYGDKSPSDYLAWKNILRSL